MYDFCGALHACNAPSLKITERAGSMREVGRKFGRWIDLVIMEKVL